MKQSTPISISISISISLAPRPIVRGLALATLALGSPALGQIGQDDCANAGLDVVGPGTYAFDTTGATTGTEGQSETNCTKFGDPAIDRDVWFTYTASQTALAIVDTCAGTGTNADTKVAAWPGSPGCPTAGTSLACNDDSCGLFSSVAINVNAGQSYVVQVGSFPGAPGGTGTITITEQPPVGGPPSGGADCYNDRATFLAACGPVTDTEDFEGFATDTSFDSGPSVPLGHGMSIVAVNSFGFRQCVDTPPFSYTDSNGTSHASCYTNADNETEVVVSFGRQVSGFGCDLSNALGSEGVELYVERGGQALFVCAVATDNVDQFIGYADGAPFDAVRFRSASLIPGTTGEGFCADNFVVCGGSFPPIGSDPSQCQTPNANSTGIPALIAARGSTSASSMNVRLSVDNVPPGQPGIFFASRTLGFVASPGGSQGNICVLGNQGRYNTLGQIFVGAGIGNPVPVGGMQVGDIPVPTNPSPGEVITAGDTWNWQAWFRDTGGNTNFSSVVSVTFVP